ncbi:helix-turn-helix domain-containing protein [Planosporangium thailandense]|uniref:Helix-turn-helix domain-containing protein n=1 Tax=Planosporangium thailandense TaxID=765197 RepID=A0ABX0XW65_9ACTN|nr:helix-turn-helix transcriptional regulator [Planosporangium thailandense]NJC70289.1 helix-turn-helix domain-containing protein [Planosporangium thailandense]
MEVLHGSANVEVTFLLPGAEVGTLSTLISREVDVPRPTGPTIARWQLARELRRLREAAGITHREIAEELGCSESKIYKIESGDVGLGRSDLLVMLDRYGLRQGADDEVRATLLDWQKQGKERGWWAKFGQLPNPYSMYIGLESAATAVRNFELAVVPGLLQTEAYARAVISATCSHDDLEEIDRRVQVRIARQSCLVEEPKLTFWTIIDEAALRRRIGGSEVMRGQLAHLLDVGKQPNVTVQVLPFSEGAHPGTLGSIAILEFPEDVHSPVAYIETYAGDVYLESDADLRRVTLTYTHMHCAALSPSKSRELIAGIAKELA